MLSVIPLLALTHTAHCVSFVLAFLLTVRHLCLFQSIVLLVRSSWTDDNLLVKERKNVHEFKRWRFPCTISY